MTAVADATTATKTSATTSKVMGFAHCLLLVLAIDLGGLASSLWQHFLLCGIKAAMITFLTVSLGSLVLLLCLSELVGIVPFAGGNFGFVRCSLGPFWGFMAACLEFLYYNMYNARSFLKLAMLVEAAHDFNPELQPLWAFIGMVFILGVNLRSGLLFWGLMMATALFTLAIVMVFWAGSFKNADLNGYAYGRKYAPQYHNDGYIGNANRYMDYAPRVLWFYSGLEILPLCSQRVKNESKVIPKALMTSFAVMFAVAIVSTFAVAVSSPGIYPSLRNISFVLQQGLEEEPSIGSKGIPILLIPPTLASMVGYLYAAGNQITAMAESGLMPKYLRPRVGSDQVPIVAMVTCALIQFISYWLIHRYKRTVFTFANNIWVLAASGLFVFVCAAFIAFRVKFGNMKRNFVSPLGIPGAVYGIVLWLYMFLISSNYHFVGHNASIIAFYVFMVLMVVYYFGFVQFVQFFSKEEQEKFMKAYVLNANQMRKKSGYQKYMAAMYRRTAAFTMLLGFGTNSRHSGATNASAAGTNKGSKATTSTDPSAAAAAVAMVSSIVSNNKVAAEPFRATCVKATSSPPIRNASLRASLTNGSMKVGWSGKVLSGENQSRRVFELLNNQTLDDVDGAGESVGTTAAEDDVVAGAVLIEEFPEHFVPVIVSSAAAGGVGVVRMADDEEAAVGSAAAVSMRAAEEAS